MDSSKQRVGKWAIIPGGHVLMDGTWNQRTKSTRYGIHFFMETFEFTFWSEFTSHFLNTIANTYWVLSFAINPWRFSQLNNYISDLISSHLFHSTLSISQSMISSKELVHWGEKKNLGKPQLRKTAEVMQTSGWTQTPLYQRKSQKGNCGVSWRHFMESSGFGGWSHGCGQLWWLDAKDRSRGQPPEVH